MKVLLPNNIIDIIDSILLSTANYRKEDVIIKCTLKSLPIVVFYCVLLYLLNTVKLSWPLGVHINWFSVNRNVTSQRSFAGLYWLTYKQHKLLHNSFWQLLLDFRPTFFLLRNWLAIHLWKVPPPTTNKRSPDTRIFISTIATAPRSRRS